MKNEITVTEEELTTVLHFISGDLVSKQRLAFDVYLGYLDFDVRKVRKAVEILISRGYKILPHGGGYSMWSEDPKPVREYLNKEYHKLTESKKKLDAMYHTFKETFGDEEAAKVEVMPGQPALEIFQQVANNPAIIEGARIIEKKEAEINAQLDRINGEHQDNTLHNV